MTDSDDKQELVIHGTDPAASVYALRDLLANADALLFDRGDKLVRLITNVRGLKRTKPMTVLNIVMLTHDHCQPVKMDKNGNIQPTALPDRIARMYLEFEEWGLPELGGISTAPIMRSDGSIVSAGGYDNATQIYCDAPPIVNVVEDPTEEQAKQALLRLRRAFRTFPFADAVMVKEGEIDVVDLDQPPGLFESSCHAALLTAAARPSLWVAPGTVITAPKLSGSGSGKGLLVRAIAMIAFGITPKPFPFGDSRAEFDKRLVAALLSGQPMVFIDNVNSALLRSDTMNSMLTERPSQLRVLGESRMLEVNTAATIVLTGNALKVTQDLARRFIWIDIDPKMDNPDTRPFRPGFLQHINGRRIQLLTAALTILRWGRLNAGQIGHGLPVGSFEDWAEWVRDPLLALGCRDIAEGIRQAKESDPDRQKVAELFATWHLKHGDEPIEQKNLHPDVLRIVAPKDQSRQYVSNELQLLVGTRLAGFVLTRTKQDKWSATTYMLLSSGVEQVPMPPPMPPPMGSHRPTHRPTHRLAKAGRNPEHFINSPMAPMGIGDIRAREKRPVKRLKSPVIDAEKASGSETTSTHRGHRIVGGDVAMSPAQDGDLANQQASVRPVSVLGNKIRDKMRHDANAKRHDQQEYDEMLPQDVMDPMQ
jgi:hypothetical protein